MSSIAPHFAVVGHPIAHSLSPIIQRAFAAQFGWCIDYRTLDVRAEDLNDTVKAFFAQQGRGLNITVPHKRAALQLAASSSAAAARAGVANVLTQQDDGSLMAHNTDGSGLLRDLQQRQQVDLQSCDVLLLGAGGAAWGVAGPLLDAGIGTLTIVNRSPAAAIALVEHLADARAQAKPWSSWAQFARFDVVINATSAGVLGSALKLADGLVDAHSLAYDLAYGAAAMPFVEWARATGARGVDGLGMLVETAAESFALWFGHQPQTEPVWRMLASQP